MSTKFMPRNVRPAGDLINLCNRFLDHIKNVLSVNTVKAYQIDLEQLVGFCRGGGIESIQQINAIIIDNWLDAMMKGEGVKPRTAARKLEAAKSLLRWAFQRELINSNPGDRCHISYDEAPVIAPPSEVMNRVIDTISTESTLGKRDRAMLLLMKDGAMRISAVASLDLYNPDQPPIHSIHPNGLIYYPCKGRTENTIVQRGTLQAVQAWLDVRHELVKRNSPTALFLSTRGSRMGRGAIHSRVKHAGKEAGVPSLHAHLLRHRRIGDLIEKTGDFRLGQALAGHKRATTTISVYGHSERIKLLKRIQGEGDENK